MATKHTKPQLLAPVQMRPQTNSAAAREPSPHEPEQPSRTDEGTAGDAAKQQPLRKKTMAELDEEMRLKMSGLSGDGGEAGVEYEDGQPVAMKRGVRNNMFRYI